MKHLYIYKMILKYVAHYLNFEMRQHQCECVKSKISILKFDVFSEKHIENVL